MKQPSVLRKLLVTLVVALLLCTISSALTLTGNVDLPGAVISTLSSPLTRPLGAAGRALSGVSSGSLSEQALKDQLAAAEAELAALREQLATLQQLQRENEQLREYLSLPTDHPELTYADASILYRGGSRVVLDRGSRDGIAVGMPVLSSGGLYGRVSEVGLTTCTVTTLLEESLRIGATVLRSGVGGTLCGPTEGESEAVLTYLDSHLNTEEDLKVGDVIVTSGLGETYPRGLLLGEITRVERDPYDRTLRAYVKLYGDMSTPSVLLIITGESSKGGGVAP